MNNEIKDEGQWSRAGMKLAQIILDKNANNINELDDEIRPMNFIDTSREVPDETVSIFKFLASRIGKFFRNQ